MAESAAMPPSIRGSVQLPGTDPDRVVLSYLRRPRLRQFRQPPAPPGGDPARSAGRGGRYRRHCLGTVRGTLVSDHPADRPADLSPRWRSSHGRLHDLDHARLRQRRLRGQYASTRRALNNRRPTPSSSRGRMLARRSVTTSSSGPGHSPSPRVQRRGPGREARPILLPGAGLTHQSSTSRSKAIPSETRSSGFPTRVRRARRAPWPRQSLRLNMAVAFAKIGDGSI